MFKVGDKVYVKGNSPAPSYTVHAVFEECTIEGTASFATDMLITSEGRTYRSHSRDLVLYKEPVVLYLYYNKYTDVASVERGQILVNSDWEVKSVEFQSR